MSQISETSFSFFKEKNIESTESRSILSIG